VVKLTEECSAAILHHLPEKKKKDPGCPTLTSMIRAQHFDQALCNLGDSVSIMPKVVFGHVNYIELSCTFLHLQMVDSTIQYPFRIAKHIQVRIWDSIVHVNFMVLDTDVDKGLPLILWWPFLSKADAHIGVGAGVIRLHINGKEKRFEFCPRKEQCSFVKDSQNPNTSTQAVRHHQK
jgi:hypothetical protein